MDTDKSKDNVKARLDLATMCDRQKQVMKPLASGCFYCYCYYNDVSIVIVIDQNNDVSIVIVITIMFYSFCISL
jgi:hypothetical protein